MFIGDDPLPEPHPFSSQHYGQTWEQFVEERREIHRNDEQGETPNERVEARLQRRNQAHAPTGPQLLTVESLEIERPILEETPEILPPAVDLREKDVLQSQWILRTQRSPPHFYSESPKMFAMHQFGMLFDTTTSTSSNKPNWIGPLGVQIMRSAELYEGDSQMRIIVEMITKTRPVDARNPSSPYLFENKLDRFANMLDIHPSGTILSTPNPLVFRCATGFLTEHGKTRPVVLYIITFIECVRYEWEMAVESASSIVLAMREGWGRSRHTMVERFLTYGIPFRTLARRPQQFTSAKCLPPIYTRPIAHATGDFRLSHFLQYQEERERHFWTPHLVALRVVVVGY